MTTPRYTVTGRMRVEHPPLVRRHRDHTLATPKAPETPVERDDYDEHDTEWGVQYVVTEVGRVNNGCISAPVTGMRLIKHPSFLPGPEVHGLYAFKESEPLDAIEVCGKLLDRFDSPWRWSVDKPLDADDGWGNLPYEEWRH